MGTHALALLAALDTACTNVAELGEAAAELFRQHPDYTIITSFPGLADSTGSGVLAEIGDDRTRFADARTLKAYAGSAPITRASRRSLSITHRHIKNNRLATVGWMWAPSPPPRTAQPPRDHYRRLREHGDRHATATPPPTDTCSTNSSDSSTTAYNTDRPSTKPKHSRRRFATPRPSGKRPATRRPCTSA